MRSSHRQRVRARGRAARLEKRIHLPTRIIRLITRYRDSASRNRDVCQVVEVGAVNRYITRGTGNDGVGNNAIDSVGDPLPMLDVVFLVQGDSR